MPPRRRKRLDPASFALPVEDLRRGTFSHASALLARDVLVADGRSPVVIVQIVSEESGLLAGTDETVALLRGGVDDWSSVAVHSLYDGDRVEAAEPEMTIEGELPRFAHVSGLCLGRVSPRTPIPTQARKVSQPARPTPW